MSETMARPDEWKQFYGGMDTTVTTSAVSDHGISSPGNSCSSSHQLSPSKGCASKPIKRRSRASKKTPITLLNANASNFRTLVQQFTGCPSTAIAVAGRKGPVNLNFEIGGHEHYNHHPNANSAMSATLSYDYYNQQSHMMYQQEKQLQGQHQQFQEMYLQGQQSANSYDNVVSNNVYLSAPNDPRSSVEFPDNFAIENVSFNDLIEDSFR